MNDRDPSTKMRVSDPSWVLGDKQMMASSTSRGVPEAKEPFK